MMAESGSARAPESPADRLRIALDLYEVCERLYRQRVRRERPEATAEEIDRVIQEWLWNRPGAEFGDAPGRVSTRRL